MKKISINRKNTLLTNRVSKLLENKSNSFKRKFELISLLSEMNLNNEEKRCLMIIPYYPNPAGLPIT